MRPYTEYADRLYLEPTGPAHIVPWDTAKTALCGVRPNADVEWFGTGDWDETEHAAWLALCHECHRDAYPQNASGEDPAVATWRKALSEG